MILNSKKNNLITAPLASCVTFTTASALKDVHRGGNAKVLDKKIDLLKIKNPTLPKYDLDFKKLLQSRTDIKY